jgi:Major Facilitator Superfamily
VVIPRLKPGRRHRMDIPGVVLVSTALLAICYGLVEGQHYNWGKITAVAGFPVSILVVLGAGVLLLDAFLIYEGLHQGAEPLIPFSLFRNRSYTLMNWVACTVTLGMLGIFLTFTIYLQSVLGFSALKAGLTLAPAPAVMMVIAPLTGRLSDMISGKYLLIPGLVLFAGGMSWIALAATPNATWQDFLPAMVMAGAGMGCVFPPMTTVAMRGVNPRLAGAASGMFNTMRQVGSVIGTAAVGALLQSRLASALTHEATVRSAALPASARQPFIGEFRNAASGALQAGPGGGVTIAPGTPPALAAEIRRIGQDVFTHGYVLAMRWTLVLPIAVVGLAAVSCLALTRRSQLRPAPPARRRPAPAHPAAARAARPVADHGPGGWVPGFQDP